MRRPWSAHATSIQASLKPGYLNCRALNAVRLSTSLTAGARRITHSVTLPSTVVEPALPGAVGPLSGAVLECFRGTAARNRLDSGMHSYQRHGPITGRYGKHSVPVRWLQ